MGIKKQHSKKIPTPNMGTDQFHAIAIPRILDALTLDVEQFVKAAEKQPKLMYSAGVHHTRAERKLEERKLELDRVIANVGGQIRAVASTIGDKITDKAVSTQVEVDPTVMVLQDEVIILKQVAAKMKYLVEAMRHRRDALEALTLQANREMNAYKQGNN